MPADEFRVLKEVGVLPSTEGSEIKFSIDEYRGYKYGSIRKYLKRDSYSGPTRAGITMSKDIVSGVLSSLLKLSKAAPPADELELGKFAKRPGLSVVARITVYQGSTGIDLREWQEDVAYKGWTKRGIRLPFEQIDDITSYLKKMREEMA
ncbi:MAG: hypothetical protein GX410_04425 [Elusimicrobia bacterium]|nr:hypothetical protein [Elusimicrobiota bacterium]